MKVAVSIFSNTWYKIELILGLQLKTISTCYETPFITSFSIMINTFLKVEIRQGGLEQVH